MHVMEFKVIDTDLDECVILADHTGVFCNDASALKREDEERLDGPGYDDVDGVWKQLAQIRQLVELPLRHPKLFKTLGARPPRGLGSTACPAPARRCWRAIASESAANFIVVNGPESMSLMAGHSEDNLRKVLRRRPGAVHYLFIFMDKVDAIAPNREKTHGEVERRVVSQLLTLMDGLRSRAQVMVIGTTNLRLRGRLPVHPPEDGRRRPRGRHHRRGGA